MILFVRMCIFSYIESGNWSTPRKNRRGWGRWRLKISKPLGFGASKIRGTGLLNTPVASLVKLLPSFQSNGWIWFETRYIRWLSMYPIFLCRLWHLLVEKWIKWFYFDSGCNKSLQFEKLLQFSSTTYFFLSLSNSNT